MHLVGDHECKYLKKKKTEDSVGSFVDKITGGYEPSDVGSKNELLSLIQDHFYS